VKTPKKVKNGYFKVKWVVKMGKNEKWLDQKVENMGLNGKN